MPSVQSKLVLHFTGKVEFPIQDFLEEYKELADKCGLTNFQKVETVIQYVDHSQHHVWTMLPGYINHNWDDLCNKLCEEYVNPSTESKFSKQKLVDFTNKYAWKHMNDKTDVIHYHWQFNTLSKTLVDSGRITKQECNITFWHSFHPKDQKSLHEHLIAKHPDQPRGQAFNYKDVLKTVRAVFSGDDDFLLLEPLPQHYQSDCAQERRTERSSCDKYTYSDNSEEQFPSWGHQHLPHIETKTI